MNKTLLCLALAFAVPVMGMENYKEFFENEDKLLSAAGKNNSWRINADTCNKIELQAHINTVSQQFDGRYGFDIKEITKTKLELEVRRVSRIKALLDSVKLDIYLDETLSTSFNSFSNRLKDMRKIFERSCSKLSVLNITNAVFNIQSINEIIDLYDDEYTRTGLEIAQQGSIDAEVYNSLKYYNSLK